MILWTDKHTINPISLCKTGGELYNDYKSEYMEEKKLGHLSNLDHHVTKCPKCDLGICKLCCHRFVNHFGIGRKCYMPFTIKGETNDCPCEGCSRIE